MSIMLVRQQPQRGDKLIARGIALGGGRVSRPATQMARPVTQVPGYPHKAGSKPAAYSPQGFVWVAGGFSLRQVGSMADVPDNGEQALEIAGGFSLRKVGSMADVVPASTEASPLHSAGVLRTRAGAGAAIEHQRVHPAEVARPMDGPPVAGPSSAEGFGPQAEASGGREPSADGPVPLWVATNRQVRPLLGG